LTLTGILLLLASLGGVAFGIFMAIHPKTHESGRLFAIWWVPAVAAAVGILLRDPVTFSVALLCFLLAGAAFTAERSGPQRPTAKRKKTVRKMSELTTQENKADRSRRSGRPRNYKRAAS
jgi:hypothetical protein